MTHIISLVAKMYKEPAQRLYWDRDYVVQADRAEKMGFVRYKTHGNSGWWELTDAGRTWIEHQEIE